MNIYATECSKRAHADADEFTTRHQPVGIIPLSNCENHMLHVREGRGPYYISQ